MMPAFVNSPEDEARWARAKKAVKRARKKQQSEFDSQDWGLTTHIYQRIKKSQSFKEKLELFDLLKGSLQRRWKVDTKSKEFKQNKKVASIWSSENNPEDARDAMATIQGNMRKRMLHKLSGETETKMHPDGTRSFKLHRGMSNNEHKNTIKQGKYNNDQRSSWTPKKDVANEFAELSGAESAKFSFKPTMGEKSHVVSAWVHENNIHTMPRMFNAGTKKHDRDIVHKEQEVVVGNHIGGMEKNHSLPTTSVETKKPKMMGGISHYSPKIKKANCWLFKAKEYLKGGRADDMEDKDFSKKERKQLKMGKKVEAEHTSNKNEQKEIARDHVKEFPEYYTHLQRMEKMLKLHEQKKKS
jgi:hypothetical protein